MSEEAREQAQAKKLTLLVAENKTGYFGVSLLSQPGQLKPYQARVSRDGTTVGLGIFATAEEAALCVARSPEGQAVAATRAAAAPPLTSEEARQQAQAEELTLLLADNKAGYFGVYHLPGRPKPYQARVNRGGKLVSLGHFATAEEAALCVARSPEGQAAAAERAAAAPPLTSEEARQQAQAEELTLRVAENEVGYYGVSLAKAGQPKPYQAHVQRGGRRVHLGSFATAEEAALCVARSPEGQAVAAERAAAAPVPLTSEEARQQAQAEGLTLLVADNKAGYFGVHLNPGRSKPYQAKVRRGGKQVSLGNFATAEEAALSVARSPEGHAVAAERAAAAPVPLTSEEARQQAQAEGLTLIVADNNAGYLGVCLAHPGSPKPYQAKVRRGGKEVYLGCFATAEEAALHVARSPEGQAAAARAAAAESQGTLPAAVPPGAILKEEDAAPPMPPGTFVKDEGVVPPMPPDAFVKVEVVVKEEAAAGSDGRPKMQRTT
eukprot:scaffold6934_cov66-Phaeocystis_antarctica.AAC.5